MNNIRFATVIHILTLLAKADEPLSSTYMAGSININPAIVRKEILHLKAMGLVETKEGKGGGISLNKPAASIQLSDVYRSISTQSALGKTNEPNPACLVGRQINKHLSDLYAAAEQALLDELRTVTLADFVKKFE